MRSMTDREKIGQRLVAGFPGTKPTEEFRHLIEEYKIGNIILFKHNVESEEQLKNLCAELRKMVIDSTGIEPFITIDQEGGAVTRLPDSDINIPGAMAVCASGDPHNAYDMGLITAQRLRSYGINFDLAPVMDINCNPDNPVIGVRSYADTPDRVSEYGSQMIKGLLDGGVYSSLKHFPGHGDTATDSHLGLPVIDKSYEQLSKFELIPFIAGMEAGVPAVMTTHILFPQIEKEKIPATMSHTIMTGILREKLGFQGMIISDCMEMQAVAKFYGTVKGTIAAMNAGVDMVFISQTPGLCMEAAKEALERLEDGTLDREMTDSSADRIIRFKEKMLAMKPKEFGNESECRVRTEEVRGESITAVQIPDSGIPCIGDDPVFVGCHDYQTSLAANKAVSVFDFADEMKKRCGFGDAVVYSRNPDSCEIDRILQEIKGHSCIILGTYNGHLQKEQMTLRDRISRESGIPVIHCALRNPYDLRDEDPKVSAIAAWEYTQNGFDRLWEIISGSRKAVGRMPISL